MPLTPGDKLGPYEIVAPIGKGGMGEVYRAHDPRTGRDVAIKVSAERFAERFDREIRAVAALNHPNICTLFDVGPDYLVMELIEGPTLSERIKEGAIPLEEALTLARQIVAALEAAHESGITHRDLKPGNIKIKPDGAVKVLDFGLAKMGGAQPSSSPEISPTLSMTATREGMILGTAAYMAPEQAKGKLVDKRADIWAFGVVLHEMLTGRPLFQRDDVTETLAAVVLTAPDLDHAPLEVRRLLQKCLEKDPKRRLRDIGDAWELLEPRELRGAGFSLPRAFSPAPWILSGVLLLALAAAVAWIFRPAPAPTITRFTIPLGEGQQFTNIGRSYLAISPDGTEIAYVANRRLYLRSMQDLDARAIPGTEGPVGVTLPAFSPDGKSLVYWANADRALKRVDLSGGAPVTVCGNVTPTSLTWGSDGIAFAQPGRILRVSPNGGEPEPLVKLKDNEQAEGPQILPGGQAALFTLAAGTSSSGAAWDQAKIVAQNLKSGARKTIIDGGSDARYLAAGRLVYALNGVLFAQAFDPRRLETTGGPVSILEGVARGFYGAAQFAFSNTGSLIYVPGPASGAVLGHGTLGLVDRKGDAEPLKNIPPAAYNCPRVSRDGKRVAYQIDDPREPGIWIYELSGATAPRRLTLPGTGANRDPIWSQDGTRVAFQSDREGDLGIFWQLADGIGAAERLTKPGKGIADIPDSWSPDGQTFSFTEETSKAGAVWTYSMRDRKATVFAQAPGARFGRSVFSPDGRWIAYQDYTSTGNLSVYVQPFPPAATRYQVPQDSGIEDPLWSPDGKELFYSPGPGLLGSVSVDFKPSLSFGSPVRAKAAFNTAPPTSVRPFDILPDGKHFIGVIQAGAGHTSAGAAPSQIQVVLNWFEDVKQRVPVR